METSHKPFPMGIAMVASMVLVAVLGIAYVLRAPTQSLPPSLVVPYASTHDAAFDYAPLNRVQHRYVNNLGMVDYAALKSHPQDLERFLQEVAATSPHTNIATFTSRRQALAYWIDAYNASMMKAVIDAYPVSSIMKIGGKSGVFDVKSRICGRKSLSLNDIEDGIIRQEFLEPRAHFALNCASLGCPWLPQEAFTPSKLDEQLDKAAHNFFTDPTHLRVDAAHHTVYLSPILQWDRDDFLRWLHDVKGLQKPTVLDFVRLYVPAATARSIGKDFKVVYLPYDWRLNDQGAPWAQLRAGAPSAP